MNMKNIALFGIIFALLIIVGFMQSWVVAFGILNLCLLSSIMALGVNIQWGYAGLFSVGTMGFVALGGVAAVVTSMPPVNEAWSAGMLGILASMAIAIATILIAIRIWRKMPSGRNRSLTMAATLIIGFVVYRYVFDPAVASIERIDPAGTGYLGGLGLPILVSWGVGGLFAAGAAWVIGKIRLACGPIIWRLRPLGLPRS